MVSVGDVLNEETGELSGGRMQPQDDKYLACGRRQRIQYGDVGMRLGGGAAGYEGLQYCGSGWVCPVCSGKIQSSRAAELGKVLAWARGEKHTLVMVTMTVRHRAQHPLESVWDAVSAGWARVTEGEGALNWSSEKLEHFEERRDRWEEKYQLALEGRGRMPANGHRYREAKEWDELHAGYRAWGDARAEEGPSAAARFAPARRIGDQERRGVLGWARAVEVTHGLNGWHVHVHAVMVLTGGRSDAERNAYKLGDSMFRRWKAGIGKTGFTAVAHTGGLHVSVRGGAEKRLAEYLAKDGFASDDSEAKIRASVGKQGTELAWEAALGDAKWGKRGGRTPFQVLAEMDWESPGRDLKIWREWVRGSAGRLALTWSSGLRDLAALPDAKTDEEIAGEELGGELVLKLPHSSWYLVRDHAAQLLTVLEEGGVPAVCELLDVYGATWVLPDPSTPVTKP